MLFSYRSSTLTPTSIARTVFKTTSRSKPPTSSPVFPDPKPPRNHGTRSPPRGSPSSSPRTYRNHRFSAASTRHTTSKATSSAPNSPSQGAPHLSPSSVPTSPQTPAPPPHQITTHLRHPPSTLPPPTRRRLVRTTSEYADLSCHGSRTPPRRPPVTTTSSS